MLDKRVENRLSNLIIMLLLLYFCPPFLEGKNNYSLLDDVINELILRLNTSYISTNSINDDFHLFEKKTQWHSHKALTFKKNVEAINNDGQKRYIRIHFSGFEYSNKNQCKRAFIELLNCFPIDCAKISLYQNANGIKSIPRYVFKTEKLIIALSISCEDQLNSFEDWAKAIQSIKDSLSSIKNNIIEFSVGCGGPVIWKKRNG